jgi:hypothetical protein
MLYLVFGEYFRQRLAIQRNSSGQVVPFLRDHKVSGFSMADLIPSSIGLYRELGHR